MKITMVIGHLWQGGAERVCVNLANAFHEKGHSVELIVSSLDSAFYLNEIKKGVSVIEIGSTNFLTVFLYYFNYSLKNKKNKFLVFNYNLSFILSLVKKIIPLRLISRSINTLSEEIKKDGFLKRLIKKKLISFALNSSDVVIAQSSGMKKDLIISGVLESKIKVINNPIAEKFFNTSISAEKNNYVLFVGRLAEQKNLFTLIDAINLIKNDLQLLIIGDGELRPSLQSYVQKIGLEERIKFLGQKPDTIKYYKAAICTVLTSHFEGFPNVLIESIACGTPIVAFDCPYGPSEIIQNERNGYLVENNDIEDFCRKVELISKNPFSPEEVKSTSEPYKSSNIILQYLKII